MARQFTERILYKGTIHEKFEGVEFTQEDWRELWDKGILDSEDIKLADDWVTTFPPNQWYTKYAKRMYSPSLDRLRATTFGEFYGNGIVD